MSTSSQSQPIFAKATREAEDTGASVTEQERHDAYEAAAAHLPRLDFSGWIWTDEEVDVLRKACAKRFGETLRTESLFAIATAGMRLLAARQRERQAA